MRLERSSTLLFLVALIAAITMVVSGCAKKVIKEEESVTSGVVVTETQPEAKEEVVEEVAVAEEPTVEEIIEGEASTGAKTSHTVVKGEHLWGISESSEVYDDPFQWPLIYKANRDQIKDPDLIYPDQEFDLPRDSSQEEIDDAIHEAKTRGPWSLWDGK